MRWVSPPALLSVVLLGGCIPIPPHHCAAQPRQCLRSKYPAGWNPDVRHWPTHSFTSASRMTTALMSGLLDG